MIWTYVDVYSLWKNALHSTYVFLLHLSVAYLLLHLARLLRTAAEQEQTGRKPIQPMNCA